VDVWDFAKWKIKTRMVESNNLFIKTKFRFQK
jgi:hypothetical protein